MTDQELIVTADDFTLEEMAKTFSEKHGYMFSESVNDSTLNLVFSEAGHYLACKKGKDHLTVKVDFASGASDHRRKFGGGLGQSLAKAAGLGKGFRPNILDLNAGLGGDAFVLASLGSTVTMFERHPCVHLLLENGLSRAQSFCEESVLGGSNEDCDALADTLKRMILFFGDAREVGLPQADVVYVDPMFPERKKSASVKKGMQVFHALLGQDSDADQLLDIAWAQAAYRVVVKRPRLAPFLAEKKPSYSLEGKSGRFDVYTKQALPK